MRTQKIQTDLMVLWTNLIGKTLPIGIVCADNHFITKYHLSERIIITQHHYHNHVHYYYVVTCILLVYHLKEYAHA